MGQKNLLTLNKDFLLYCKINDIEDVEVEAERIFNMGFAIAKFGTKPGKLNKVPPPPARIIKEGKKTESPEEYHNRWEKIKKDNKTLYDE